MSADNPFGDHTSAQLVASSGRGASKRKRGQVDNSTGRQSPLTRRGNQSFTPQGYMHPHQDGDTPGGAGSGAMTDAQAADVFLQNAAQFNLSSLQAASERSQGHDDSSNVDTAAAALNYSMQVPHTSEAFMGQSSGGDGDDNNFNNVGGAGDYEPAQGSDLLGDDGGSPSGASKPPIGSDEWVRWRKNNHKEVERRRRETINEGINDLARIVPNCDKNKGAILATAATYITKLQSEMSTNIDKWTFEKLVTEQAITDLSSKLRRAWEEKEAWKRLARDAGVDVDNVELDLGSDEKDEDDDLRRHDGLDRDHGHGHDDIN